MGVRLHCMGLVLVHWDSELIGCLVPVSHSMHMDFDMQNVLPEGCNGIHMCGLLFVSAYVLTYAKHPLMSTWSLCVIQ